MKKFFKCIQFFLPYGLVQLFRAVKKIYDDKEFEKMRKLSDARRRERIKSTLEKDDEIHLIPYTRIESLYSFLKDRGVDPIQAVEGSIPESSLRDIDIFLRKRLDGTSPIYALHVGNFVGISLVYLAGVLSDINEDSLVVSIDPNLPHRGVSNPQNHVAALLCKTGLQKNALIIAGYSGGKSLSNDGEIYTPEYDPVACFQGEYSPEESLHNLAKISSKKFHIALLDGNHEGEYLQNEICRLQPLLDKNSFVILDDVSRHWIEIQNVFRNSAKHGFKPVFENSRIGILSNSKD